MCPPKRRNGTVESASSIMGQRLPWRHRALLRKPSLALHCSRASSPSRGAPGKGGRSKRTAASQETAPPGIGNSRRAEGTRSSSLLEQQISAEFPKKARPKSMTHLKYNYGRCRMCLLVRETESREFGITLWLAIEYGDGTSQSLQKLKATGCNIAFQISGQPTYTNSESPAEEPPSRCGEAVRIVPSQLRR